MMKHVFRGAMLGLAGVGLLWTGMALAGPTDADKCYADKIKRAGWYSFCRMKAESKGVKKSEAPDFTKCNDKITEKFGKAETKWGAECLTLGDVGDIQTQITTDTDVLVALLAGTAASECGPDACGNGVIDDGEDCDFGDMGGGTCVTEGFELGGTLKCGAGCVYDTTGCDPCPGTMVGGYCWFLGTLGEDCSDVCGFHAMSYDPATDSYAGASGTPSNCQAVADAVGPPAGGTSCPPTFFPRCPRHSM